MSIHFVTNEKIAETSSKGNQEKWIDGDRWYKLTSLAMRRWLRP